MRGREKRGGRERHIELGRVVLEDKLRKVIKDSRRGRKVERERDIERGGWRKRGR